MLTYFDLRIYKGLNRSYYPSQQRGPARQLTDEYRLVQRMRPLAHGPESVERGNAQGGGKVAVGAAAGGGFAQLPSHFLRQPAGGRKPGGDFRAALHRRAVDSPPGFQFLAGVGRAPDAEFFLNYPGVRHPLDAALPP